MGALIIQAHYERLEQIAATFGAHAQRSAELRARLAQQADALVDSAWQGEAAQRFHAEMSRELLPALQRLAEALDEAQRVTLQIRDIIRAAEEEAAALFQGDGRAPAPSDEGGGLWGSVGGWVHGGLDVLGLVPGFGEVADGVNALIYLAEGDYLNAGLSAAAMIPFAGWGATGAKFGIRAGRELLEEGAERVVREGVEEGAERLGREGAEEVGERLAHYLDDPAPTRTIANGHKSIKDPTFLRYGELPSNTPFRRNSYDYMSDGQGRITSVTGELRDVSHPRHEHYQRKVGNSAGLATDDGGHLIGSQFGGVSEGVNLVPMSRMLNQAGGGWYRMEQEWAAALKRGESVRVDIRPVYEGVSNRPTRFEVDYWIDDIKQNRSFQNPTA
ncbi:MAG: WXG100 family type VII secretion target [Anaerolineales bacterium]|nr:WXG100 family type VII secretion target [Anaerolineales bacterium]